MTHRFHGITLAGNSVFENLNFEKLSVDPLCTSAGRFWYNTADKVNKFSTLDAGGAVVIRTIYDAESAQAALTALQASVDAVSTSTTAAIADEVTARQAAVATLTQAINDESSARVSGDNTEIAARSAAITQEISDRNAAVATAAATASSLVSSETSQRQAADAALQARDDSLQTELDSTQAGAGLSADGTFVVPTGTTYLGDATSLMDNDKLLDAAITAEASTRVSQIAALTSGLSNEVQARQQDIAGLNTQLTAYINGAVTNNANADASEAAARIAADAAIQGQVNNLKTVVGTDTDGNLIPITGTNYLDTATTVFGGAFILDYQVKVTNDTLATETAARLTSEANINGQITTERTDRINADTDLLNQINAVETGAGLQGDGSYVAPTDSNYLNAAISLFDADHILDAAVKSNNDQIGALNNVTIPGINTSIQNEITRATTAENNEATARQAGDSTNAAAIVTETNRATGAENTLTTNLAQEVTDRQAAVATISGNLATETAARISTDTSLQSQITALAAAAGDGASALKTELNAGRSTYLSAAPALTHTVVHNLNSQFVSKDIMVQGEDGVYRNDSVLVEETDANSYKVYLSVACNVKASSQKLDQLA